jgi:hypothetical protein
MSRATAAADAPSTPVESYVMGMDDNVSARSYVNQSLCQQS